MIRFFGFITGIVVGFVVPATVTLYVLQVLQVTGVFWYTLFVFVFLLLSAMIRWSLDTIVQGDDES